MRQITIHRTTRTYATLDSAEKAALKLLNQIGLQDAKGVTFTLMAGTDRGDTVRYSPVFFLQGGENTCHAFGIANAGFHVVA